MKFLALAVCLLTAALVSPGQFNSRKLDESLPAKRSVAQPTGKNSRNSLEVVSGRPSSSADLMGSSFAESLTTTPIENVLNFTVKLDNPSPAASDECGARVAVSGTTAVVTCHLDDVSVTNQGSAYVYVKSGSSWVQQAMLTASDAAAGDQFGFSVAIDGDTIVIGAVGDDGAFADQGSVYVFVRSGSVWTQEAKLTAADPGLTDRLGWRVDVSENTVVASAAYDDGSVTNEGSAYVFLRSGVPAVWTQQAKLINPTPVANDFFAASVAIDGDTAVLGGDGDDVTFGDQGSAYVFVRSGSTWTQQAFLTASDGALQDYFGISVDISGDTVVVGAIQDDGTVTDQGSAYVFVRTGSLWFQQAKLTAPGPTAGDLFGWMVSVAGDRVAISAIYDDVSVIDQGAAYLYLRTGGVWNYVDQLIASDAAAGDALGCGLAMSSNAIIGGACLDDGAFTSQGSAYIFELAPSAADVSITGRVTTASGRAIRNVSLSLMDTNGTVRYGITNAFGYYSFTRVKAGSYYVLDARHRMYQFDSRYLSVSDNLTNVNLVPNN